MAVMKRGQSYYLRFQPLKGGKWIKLATDAKTKADAAAMEKAITLACRSGDYRWLDPLTREMCIRMFTNQGWTLPPELAPPEIRPTEELTLWRAIELFGHYPGIADGKGLWRHRICLGNIVAVMGRDRPLKSVNKPLLKEYRIKRGQKAKPGTINRELSSLSKLFEVMIELEHVEVNPVHGLKALSSKSGERQVYISYQDVCRVADQCPEWYRPLIWTAYYTGMRRGEIVNLKRGHVNLSKRIITLFPEDVKEGAWKRVPLCREAALIIESAMRVSMLNSDLVFLVSDHKGVRPAGRESYKKPWERAVKALAWPDPRPRFHDLRHTWRTNARRSGMWEDLQREIMGHSTRGRSVHERYGRISDQELVEAIDKVTWDHGETEIFVAGRF